MDKREELIQLYNIYNKLLTSKENKYFEYYYFEDYSFSEIAEIFNVSKSYIGKVINKIENKLKKYEELLLIYSNKNKLFNIIKLIKDEKIKEKIKEIL